jgi:antigen flippase
MALVVRKAPDLRRAKLVGMPLPSVRNRIVAVPDCRDTDISITATSDMSIPPASATTGVSQNTSKRKESYYEILKSSALIGGSQATNIAIGIVRTKAMATLLGPAGFGLFGLYGSVQNLAQSIAGLGINSSGVRQIAVAAGTGEKIRIAQTATVLRRTAIGLGLLGALLLLAFSRQISEVTFGSTKHSTALRLLCIAVFLNLVSGGQGALIQGMRRIGDLAKMNILGAFFGFCGAVPLVYFFRERGVAPSLVVVAGAGIVISWWYSRKIDVQQSVLSLTQIWQELSSLLKLGAAFMASGLMTLGAAYVIRILILRKFGLAATGLYQSAWTLGGLYIGFILQAMGADFYPRLTSIISHEEEANRLVNEQTFVGLLLAGPGVLATITLAPLVMSVFYSAQFGAAVDVLRWICLGAMLQVVTWPMAAIIVAKAKQALLFFCELAWAAIAVTLAYLCLRTFGLNGAGIAFFGSYVFHLVLIYPIVHRLSGFRWSVENARLGAAFLLLIATVLTALLLFPGPWAFSVGMLATFGTAIYSLRLLLGLVSLHQVPRSLHRLWPIMSLRPRSVSHSPGSGG